MSAVTQWFPGDVKPVHVGLYQRNYYSPKETAPDYFDGKKWRYDGPSGEICFIQAREWRGLAEEPK